MVSVTAAMFEFHYCFASLQFFLHKEKKNQMFTLNGLALFSVFAFYMGLKKGVEREETKEK